MILSVFILSMIRQAGFQVILVQSIKLPTAASTGLTSRRVRQIKIFFCSVCKCKYRFHLKRRGVLKSTDGGETWDFLLCQVSLFTECILLMKLTAGLENLKSSSSSTTEFTGSILVNVPSRKRRVKFINQWTG